MAINELCVNICGFNGGDDLYRSVLVCDTV